MWWAAQYSKQSRNNALSLLSKMSILSPMQNVQNIRNIWVLSCSPHAFTKKQNPNFHAFFKNHLFRFFLFWCVCLMSHLQMHNIEYSVGCWDTGTSTNEVKFFVKPHSNSRASLTLFWPDLVMWRSYKGWFHPWPVGIGLKQYCKFR